MNWRDTDIGSDCRCRAAGAMTSAIAMVTRRIAARWSVRSGGNKSSLNAVLKTAIN